MAGGDKRPGLIVRIEVDDPMDLALRWLDIDELLNLRVRLVDEKIKKPLGEYRLGDLVSKLK